MNYTFTERQLASVITEAVKIYLKEEDDAYLYGAKPDGNIPMEAAKNLEGADIQINSAGTLHIERCEEKENTITMFDTQDREVRFKSMDMDRLLNGEKVNAVLLAYDGGTPYDVFISIAHASDNQRVMRYMRDLQRWGHPIFGGSKITET